MGLLPNHKFSAEPIPEVPNGIYTAVWSGWEIDVVVPEHDNKKYSFKATSGVRGIATYQMEVIDGDIWSMRDAT